MAATLERRIHIVRQRIGRTHGQAKLTEQYALLGTLLAQDKALRETDLEVTA